jgi:hypothetical protein
VHIQVLTLKSYIKFHRNKKYPFDKYHFIVSQRIIRARHVTAEDRRNAYRIVFRKPEVNRQLKRPRRR